MNEYTYNDLSLYHKETFNIVVSEEMMKEFLLLTGDNNPLHLDANWARGEGFADRVVYGMLTAALYSTLVGIYLPGRYALFQSLNTEFHKPVYIGDTLIISGTIIEKHDAFRRLIIRAEIRNQKGEKVNKAKITAGCLR